MPDAERWVEAGAAVLAHHTEHHAWRRRDLARAVLSATVDGVTLTEALDERDVALRVLRGLRPGKSIIGGAIAHLFADDPEAAALLARLAERGGE